MSDTIRRNTFDRRRSLEVGRWRIVAIRERIAVHPCDQPDLADVVEDSKNLSRIMAKMARRRNCYVSTVQVYDAIGGPRRVYCLHKVNTPSHDNALTKVFKALGWPECERGRQVAAVNNVTPDAVSIYPTRRLWEMDMSTEGYEEIRKKVEAYAAQKSAVLWVCLTESRRRKLIEWTPEIHHLSFFALWSELTTNPYGDVWQVAKGLRRPMMFVPIDVPKEVPGDVTQG